jgi:hypothetical protein
MNEDIYNEENDSNEQSNGNLWDAIVEVITTRDTPLSEIATS